MTATFALALRLELGDDMVKFLKELAGGVTDGTKAGEDWLSGPFKTDNLLVQLEDAWRELQSAHQELIEEEVERDTVIMDLRSMAAKATVLSSLATEIAVFAPIEERPKTAEEQDHIKRTKEIYDPLAVVRRVSAGLFLVSLLPSLGASAIRMVTLGKYLKDAKNASLLLKAAKVGKASFLLTLVIVSVEFIIKMIHAKKLNAEIEAARKKLKEDIGVANREVALVTIQREEAEALRKQMLEEAGVETTQGFLVSMNNAIADVSADVALVKIARNLLRIGQAPDMVLQVVQLEPEVVERIARRLKVEEALIAGDGTDAIAQKTGADPREIGLVARLLAVRGEAARGFSDVELVERHAVVDAVADIQIELATTELAKHWESLLTEPRLDAIAQDTLIPEDALLLMVPELHAHGQLWEGVPLETVLEKNPSVARNRLQAMADGLEAGKAFAATADMDPSAIAVHLRLPLSVVATA